jgi:hypothetical protein
MGTRITIDLGSEELLKAVKIAAVEKGVTVREVVIEALKQWLGKSKISREPDFQAMMQAVNDYRKKSNQDNQ